MSLKRLILVLMLCVSMGVTIFSADQVETKESSQATKGHGYSKRFYIYLPSNIDLETIKSSSFSFEVSPFDKKSVKFYFGDSSVEPSYFNLDDTGLTTLTVFDLSYATFQDKTFIGPYQRFGFKYSDLSVKMYDNTSNSRFNPTYEKRESDAKIYMPYVLAGYNFGIFDLFSIGLGLGMGYAFVDQTGDNKAHLVLKGINVTSEINIGMLF